MITFVCIVTAYVVGGTSLWFALLWFMSRRDG